MDIKVVESQNEIYHKQKLLGQGAFGKAYLVKRKIDNQLLVIKQMNINHMSEQQQKQTIKQAQILKNLNHPNIVRFVQVYVTKQNKLKIVMEYAQCGDLSKSISQHKKNKKYFDQNFILDWFTQICLAIKHVHDRKILHRDIKGQNIFVTKNNTLKLGDFGIARVLNKTFQKARTVVGTPYYLSPQIIQNKPYSFKSDIWSIGVVLYQLCALTHPFTATSLQFLALKIVKGSYNPIPNHYSKQLKNIVSLMLSLDPNKRPSINDIFKNSLIQDRIKKFLTETKRVNEFSHTILHNHKVQLLTNRLSQIKQQKDYQKQRNKLKQQEQMLRQKFQRKKSQDKIKLQQQQIKNKQKQTQLNRQKDRIIQIQREKQKQQQKKIELFQKQRKQYQRRKMILIQQKKKQQIQMKAQKQYQQRQNIAKYYQKKARQQQQISKVKQKQAQVFYRQNLRDQEFRQMQKIKKNQQKQIQQQKKKKQLQQFARKQYFQNQQIMKRARQRANQDQYSEKKIQIQTNVCQDENQNYKKKHLQNFHFENKRKNQKLYSPTAQINKNKIDSTNANNNKIQTNQVNKNEKKGVINDNNLVNNEEQKPNLSVRQKMKKDRQNFLKNSSKNKIEQIIINESPKKNIETIKGAKWQRPKSRQKQIFPEINNQVKKQIRSQTQEDQNLGQKTYDLIGTKVSPKDQQQFNRYLSQLQGLLQNINKNLEDVQVKNNKNDNIKQNLTPIQSQIQSKYISKLLRNQKQCNIDIGQIVQQQQIVYRQDDEDTFKLSMTAQFQNSLKAYKTNRQNIKQNNDNLPQIQTSTDLDYFSNFSKLETLRMNLQDKFGTDNFIQLYRYLQRQMQQKGLQGFSNVNQIVDEISKRIKISKIDIMQSFTLLLTLIHMEERAMNN